MIRRDTALEMNREDHYRMVAWDWYERNEPRERLPLAWCRLSCVCHSCRQADFNAYYVHGMRLEVTGL